LLDLAREPLGHGDELDVGVPAPGGQPADLEADADVPVRAVERAEAAEDRADLGVDRRLLVGRDRGDRRVVRDGDDLEGEGGAGGGGAWRERREGVGGSAEGTLSGP